MLDVHLTLATLDHLQIRPLQIDKGFSAAQWIGLD